MKLDLTQTYKRIDNILYCNDIAIVKFTHSKFPDFDPLSEQGVKYMQSYIDTWKDHNYFEILPGWMVADDVQEELIDVEKCRTSVEYFVEKVVIPFNEIRPKSSQNTSGSLKFHEDLSKSMTQSSEIESKWSESDFNPQWSRKQQVEFWVDRGHTSANTIAQIINANPSYVQRLLKQVKDEEAKS